MGENVLFWLRRIHERRRKGWHWKLKREVEGRRGEGREEMREVEKR